MATANLNKPFLTVGEAATLLGQDRSTVYRAIKEERSLCPSCDFPVASSSLAQPSRG